MTEESTSKHHLLHGRLLARNVVWNLVGNGAPMLVAVFTIPILIRGLGKERFGLLALAWALIGYAGLFDLGLGRALTQVVAKKLGAGDTRAVPALAWTSMLLMLGLGLAGSVAVMLICPWLTHLLKVPASLQFEAIRSFYLLGLSLPAVIATTGLRGLLEAHQRFGLVNALRLPMGVFTFVGPISVLPFSKTLLPVVAVLVAGRYVACGAHAWVCLKVIPELRQRPTIDRACVPALLSYGGWMTVNNVVGPLMMYMDRFLIGSIVSVAAVAYYTAPIDMVLRLAILPNAVVGVLFPAFAMTAQQNPERASLLLSRGLRYVYLAMFPIVLVLITFSHEILRVWLGATFEQQGAVVLCWTAAGIFINSLSTIPFTLIQGMGRPDLTAWLLMAELPLYAALLWAMTRSSGIEGTAIAWTLRLAVEAGLLFFFSFSVLPHEPRLVSGLSVAILCGLAVFFLASLPQNLAGRATFFTASLLGFGALAWFRGLTRGERQFLIGSPAELPVQMHAD